MEGERLCSLFLGGWGQLFYRVQKVVGGGKGV